MPDSIPIALQLYTVREQCAADFAGTLKAVAEMGYAGVELAGFHGNTAAEIRAMLDDLGLQCAGSHTGLDILENDLARGIDDCQTLGSKWVVLPFLPEDRRQSGDAYRQLGELLDSIGAACREQELTFCYHNHAFEFEQFDGEYGFDILYGATDPALVQAEVDTYWVQRGGEDPAAYIRKYSGRTPLIHLKDMKDEPDQGFAPVGEGVLDFDAIFAASESSNAAWYIVEQDRCDQPPLESARLSLSNLRRMGKA